MAALYHLDREAAIGGRTKPTFLEAFGVSAVERYGDSRKVKPVASRPF
jgi:hypothetical protein